MHMVQWKQWTFLLGVVLFIGIVGGVLLMAVPVGAWGFPEAKEPGSLQALPTPDVPELGYCEIVDAEEWVSATQTRPVRLQRCVIPDDEWIRANPGKRVSPADVVPVDTPPVALPAISVEAPNPTQ
ncbi:hypothetical protein [Roseiflexus sp. RS-1]|jgi:hypothetical protein|uniref:hypothetical protein n=1 Tax=Roseiflexus sp. (strain RS-1) TaxID=357808 RepID=UPI0012EDDD0D|nr:hypothetical protein [Roseiflexus sp. RS-1]MBO9348930.1 hypothetical protein [Chloroflexus sp.]